MEHVHEAWEGPAVGGPLDGQTLTAWAPKGAVVVSESTQQVWVYDWDGERFTGRDAGQLDQIALEQAQADGGRCIRVVD